MGHETNPWLSSDRPRGADYDRRFADLAASGSDVHGEANLVRQLGVDTVIETVLDAGCGTGRSAIELARHGLAVTGVDLDAGMLEVARQKAPSLEWIQADLAQIDLDKRFDLILAAGNVMIFLSPGSEPAVIANLARHLNPGGRLLAGFSLKENGLDLATYDQLCAAAGLELDARWATWDQDDFTPGGDYAVSIHRA